MGIMATTLYDELNNLLTQHSTPLTTVKLEGDYEQFFKAYVPADPFNDTRRLRLRAFLRQTIQAFTGQVDLTQLKALVGQFEARLDDAPLPELRMFENQTDDLDPKDVQDAMQQIYQSMRTLQKVREEGQELLSVLRQLQTLYATLRKSLTAFVSCEDTEPTAFKHVSERTRFLEPFVNDIGSHEEVLNLYKGRVVQLLDETLPQRNNVLMRTESSIRLICKQHEPEARLNGADSRSHTTQPAWGGSKGVSNTQRGDDFGGFSVEDANRG